MHALTSLNKAIADDLARATRARTRAHLATASTRADNWLVGLALLLALAGICQ